jgi:PAS domain S-box-containing protein
VRLIYIKDCDGRFLLLNRAFEQAFNVSSTDLVGKTDYDLLPPDMASTYLRNDQEVLTSGKPLVFEETILIANEVHTVLSVKVPMYGDDGQPYGVCGISTDITSRKRVEEAIRTLNAELEKRVQQRTAELEAANKDLKDFAYVVSHDLKAPLRGIQRLVGWLLEDYPVELDEEGQKMVDLLRNRVARMENLIDGILQYSQIGRVEEASQPINLHELLQEIIDILEPPPHISIVIERELPTVTGGRTHLMQVFMNLLSNAIKFMDKPDGKITIGYEETQSEMSEPLPVPPGE